MKPFELTRRKLTFFVIFILLTVSKTAICQQTNNWYFGSAAGFPNTGLRIDFTSGSPVVSTCYPLMTEEGSSSISDNNGNPLFYTDGVTIWDASTNTAFGTGMNGGSSTTQSAIVMPRPGFTNQWLVFTSGVLSNPGTYYYVVTGSPGAFTLSAATQLVPAATVGEGLFVIGSTKPGTSFWVITRATDAAGQVRAFEVFNNGTVSTTAISSTLSGPGFTNTSYTSKIGTIKSNTCQNKLAFTYLNGHADLVDFDAATGQVVANTARRINVTSTGGNSGSYGIEFSPNDAYLYITNLASSQLYRHDIAANTTAVFATVTGEAGQLQAGPDGRIYMARNTGTTAPSYLGVINNPGDAGATFNATGVTLTNVACGGNTGFAYRGLPTFPKSLVVNDPILNPGNGTYCTNTAIPLSFMFGGSVSSGTISWTATGGGQTFTPGGATSTSSTPTVSFSTTGVKTVTLTLQDACGRTYTKSMTFNITSPLVPSGTITCGANSITLDNPAIDPNEPNYVWYRNSVSSSNIIGVGTPVNYLLGGNSAKPSNICVGVATSAAQTTGSNSIGNTGASMTWAANGTPYTSPAFDVLANNLILKSFVIRFWTCTATLNVTIRDGSNTIIYNENHAITGCASGTIHTINVNTTLPAGSGYKITISGTGAQFQGGAWTGGTNAGQITYNAVASAGTSSIGNLQYDYKNYTINSGCTTPQCYPVSCTLPVELLEFSGKEIQNGILLTWNTASEKNNDKFIVQSSSDGIHFTSLGSVDGGGNTNTIKFYNFIDTELFEGIKYYRLIQKDYDGTENVSNVIAVKHGETIRFNIYPNPANHEFKILFSKNTKAELKLYDLLGRQLIAEKFETNQENDIAIGAELDAGSYILEIITNEGKYRYKLIKE
ncbi:MAG: T9SS type A sorting domain-containing protein [Cytophagaceae bacterium]